MPLTRNKSEPDVFCIQNDYKNQIHNDQDLFRS